MLPSPLNTPMALIASSPRTLTPRSSCLGASVRWICRDCSSRLPSSRVRKNGLTVSIRTPSRHSPRQEGVKAFCPTYQRRLQSGHVSEAGNHMKRDLPSQMEGRRSNAAKRFSHVMDHLQSNIFIAGQRLNDLTGYSGIEALKKDIELQGKS